MELNLVLIYLTFISSYVITSILCFINDIKKPEFKLVDDKIQINNRRELIYLYKKALFIVSKNIFFWIPLFFACLGLVYNLLIGNLFQTYFFNIYDIPKFAINFILIDIFFYISHRIFHIGFLYKKYHKIHHEFKKPVAVAALYTHPIDCIFANVLPVLLPIIILKEGIIISNLWVLIAVVNTIYISHKGDKDLSEFHDIHHEKFNYNYGTEMFMDKLFNTKYVENIKN